MTKKQLLAEIDQRGLTFFKDSAGLSKMAELRKLLVDHEQGKIKRKDEKDETMKTTARASTAGGSRKKKAATEPSTDQKYSKMTKKQLLKEIRDRGLESIRESNGFTKMNDLRQLLVDFDSDVVKNKEKEKSTTDPIREQSNAAGGVHGDQEDAEDQYTIHLEL